jgi:hypothetical protein
MATGLFAVLRTRGPAWHDALAMEQQGGPLAGTRDVLLIVRAASAAEVAARLADDGWSAKGLLRTLWVHPWGLRLGCLGP